MRLKTQFLAAALSLTALSLVFGQGTFQNLDFENGSFIPIPGDPFGRVQFGPAMPGWSGYVGTNQIDWILHNDQFLSTAADYLDFIQFSNEPIPEPSLFGLFALGALFLGWRVRKSSSR